MEEEETHAGLLLGRAHSAGLPGAGSPCSTIIGSARGPSTMEGVAAGATPQSTPVHEPAEAAGLGKVIWFCILEIAGVAVGWALALYFFGSVFASMGVLGLGPNPTPAQVSAAVAPAFRSMIEIVPTGMAVEIVAWIVLTLGFRDLGKVDRGKFHVPSVFMVVMMGSLAVVGMAAVSLTSGIPQLIAQMPPAQGGALTPASAALVTSMAGDFLFLALGGVLTIVGVVGGLILGLWRVGERYGETTIKVGAVFTIIPLLNVVGAVLILMGARQARGRLA